MAMRHRSLSGWPSGRRLRDSTRLAQRAVRATIARSGSFFRSSVERFGTIMIHLFPMRMMSKALRHSRSFAAVAMDSSGRWRLGILVAASSTRGLQMSWAFGEDTVVRGRNGAGSASESASSRAAMIRWPLRPCPSSHPLSTSGRAAPGSPENPARARKTKRPRTAMCRRTGPP